MITTKLKERHQGIKKCQTTKPSIKEPRTHARAEAKDHFIDSHNNNSMPGYTQNHPSHKTPTSTPTHSSPSTPYSPPKISSLFSTTNCTISFLLATSLISLSTLRSRMIVGANTTATFLGVMRLTDAFETTRARWKMRNSRTSRWMGGRREKVLRRWAQRAGVSDSGIAGGC